jgi:hypothetical protein
MGKSSSQGTTRCITGTSRVDCSYCKWRYLKFAIFGHYFDSASAERNDNYGDTRFKK